MTQPPSADPRAFAALGDPDATVILPAVRGDAAGAATEQPPTAGRHRRVDGDETVVLPTVPAGADGGGPTATAGAPAQESSGGIGRHSAGMALGSLISRGTGFLRTALIAAALGRVVGDAYTNATLFPGMVYELLLGGVLSSVLVPMLVRARDSDPDRGEAYAQRLLSGAVVFLAGTTVLAVLAAPLLSLSVANSSNRELTTTLSYLILPTIFFYGLAALIAAVLNTRGHFAAPMWTPILNNLVLCVVCGLLLALPGPKELTLDNISTPTILLLGLGTLAGIAIQALALLPVLRRVGFRWRWRFDLRALHLRELGRLGAWMICYVAVSQLAVIAIGKIANQAAKKNGAGILIYNNVYLLMMMAHGIVAVSIITALMPRISAAAAAGRYGDLAADLSRGTRLVIVLLVPVSVAYFALAHPLSIILFRYGRFTSADAAATALVMGGAAFALVPFAISQLQTFAFYALPDTKTPALVNMPVVAVRILVDLLAFVALPATAVAAGLMVGNAVSFVAAVVLSGLLLRRRVGRLGLRRVAVVGVKAAVAGVAALVVGWLATTALVAALGDRKLASLLTLAVGGGLIAAVYLGVGYLLRIAEVSEAVGMIRAKLGR